MRTIPQSDAPAARNAERLLYAVGRWLATGQTAQAQAGLESLLASDARDVQAHLLLGGIAWKQDRIRDATRHALDAAHAPGDDPKRICDVVAALIEVGEMVVARSLLRHQAIEKSDSVEILMRASGLHQMLGEHVQALSLLHRAHAAGMAGPDLYCYRGVQLAFNGYLQEAQSDLENCLCMNPAAGRAWLMLARMRTQTRQDNHLRLLEHAARIVRRNSEDHAAIEFARYKELEELGLLEQAWQCLSSGNAIMRGRLGHNPDRESKLFEQLRNICSAEFLRPANRVHEGPQPIFIVGLPRSGTTLLERMLGNHPQVASAGELGDFRRQLHWCTDHHGLETLDEETLIRLPDIDWFELGRRYLRQTQWRAEGKAFFTDKLPANWMVAGLIRKALPQARILHLTRDPMAVCFSNYRSMFGRSYPYSYDLDWLARHHALYRKTMDHWRAMSPGSILDVSSSGLVDDTPDTMRGVFAFCGLEYRPEYLDPRRNRTPVATLSMAQVRAPLRPGKSDEWRKYARQLAPLHDRIAS
jgi:tetratricopeptide (TPR) repeat protein